MGCVEYWRGCTLTCTPHTQPLQEDEDCTSPSPTLQTQSWRRRWARLSGREGRQGGVAGRVGWRAGSGGGPGGEAGQVVRGGWIFGLKNVLE